MIKILHVTPHMGGGVGNVISRLAISCDSRMNHKLVILDKPIKDHYLKITEDSGTEIHIASESKDMERHVKQSDMVLIHWWHHPKISKFLYEFPLVPARVIIWTHISNLTVPAINPEFLSSATRVLFTTEASYQAEEFSDLPYAKLKDKTGVVYACGGFDNFPKIKRKKHMGFNIGYLGIADFSKLHPDYVEFCNSVNIDCVKFILAGDAPAKGVIETQALKKGIAHKFDFKGYVDDIIPVLSEFDCLGYPLMTSHTCTTENSILEAMAAEAPPVLLNQLTEKYIIQDGKTGILVSGIEEYGQAMRYLYMNPDIRKRMGKRARDFVAKKHTAKNFLDSFYKNCEIAMNESKRSMNFKPFLGGTPADWFVSCLGKDKIHFKMSLENSGSMNEDIKNLIMASSPLLAQANKSSVMHYQREFPDNDMLCLWSNILKGRIL